MNEYISNVKQISFVNVSATSDWYDIIYVPDFLHFLRRSRWLL